MDKKVYDFVISAKSLGQSKEQIYQQLLASGVSLIQIEAVFGNLERPTVLESVPMMEIQPQVTEVRETYIPQPVKNVVTSESAVQERAVPSAAATPKEKVKASQVLGILGTIFIGAGIFSFIAGNWEAMPDLFKVFLIVVFMFAAYGSGWYVREVKKMEKLGEALILLGTIIYGAGIFLIAQIFNIRTAWPDGFVLWFLGALLIGWAMETKISYVLAVILGTVAVFGYPLDIFDSAFSHGGNGVFDNFQMTSVFLLVIAVVALFGTGLFIRAEMSIEDKSNF